jgi:hypothetical protein
VVLGRAAMASHSAMTASGLVEVGLSKVAERLAGVLALASTDVAVDLIIEVLGKRHLGSLVTSLASSSDKLLELDTSDEVLILGGHETVILG